MRRDLDLELIGSHRQSTRRADRTKSRLEGTFPAMPRRAQSAAIACPSAVRVASSVASTFRLSATVTKSAKASMFCNLKWKRTPIEGWKLRISAALVA